MIFDIPLAAPATVIAAVSIDIDGTILVQMAAFLLSIPMLHYLLFKPYLKTRELRSENVEGSEEEAGEMVARAEVLQEEYQTKMRKARRDAQDVRESLRDQGLAEQRDIQQEVSDELDAKLKKERAAIEDHVEEARRDIEERAEGLADAMVQKLMPNQG